MKILMPAARPAFCKALSRVASDAPCRTATSSRIGKNGSRMRHEIGCGFTHQHCQTENQGETHGEACVAHLLFASSCCGANRVWHLQASSPGIKKPYVLDIVPQKSHQKKLYRSQERRKSVCVARLASTSDKSTSRKFALFLRGKGERKAHTYDMGCYRQLREVSCEASMSKDTVQIIVEL